MNSLAFLAGLITYIVVGTVCGLMALGVGFMAEPGRSIYAQIIVFGPLFPTGLVVGLVARSRVWALALAVAVALVAFSFSLLLAHGPIVYFLRNEASPWAVVVQGTYQLALYVAVCIFGAWAGSVVRYGRRSTPLRQS